MQFMVLIKADDKFEAGAPPDEKVLAAMGNYNRESIASGVMLAGRGLQPSSQGVRVKFSAGKPSVVDGPFAEAKEIVAGYWLIEVNSKEEAIEWVKRCPNMMGDEAEFEIRELGCTGGL
jgi:hypothetical protein